MTETSNVPEAAKPAYREVEADLEVGCRERAADGVLTSATRPCSRSCGTSSVRTTNPPRGINVKDRAAVRARRVARPMVAEEAGRPMP